MKKILFLCLMAVLGVADVMAQDDIYTLRQEKEYVGINYLQDETLAKSVGLPHALTGKGVLVVMFDEKPLYRHIVFRDPVTRQSRVKHVYDAQQKKMYTIPDDSTIVDDEFKVSTSHGTGTTNIAAGGFEGGVEEAGIATSADIMSIPNEFDKNKMEIPDLAMVRHYADSLGVPCVVNISFRVGETSKLFIERTKLMEQLENFTDNGKAPGRILCFSSGNGAEKNRGLAGLTYTFESDNDTLKVLSEPIITGHKCYAMCSDIESSKVILEVYDTEKNCIVDNFTVTAKGGQEITDTAQLQQFISVKKDIYGNDFFVMNDPSILCDDDNQAFSYKFTGKKGTKLTIQMVDFNGNTPEGYTGSNVQLPMSGFELKCCTPSVISVGAIATKDCLDDTYSKPCAQGEVWMASSWGKDVAGNEYPDVCAPGVHILHAATSGVLPTTDSDDPSKTWYYTYGTGTSDAAPFITGVAACLLEIDPTLTVERLRKLLYATNDWTDYCHNDIGNIGGHGILNAKELVKAFVAETTGIKNIVATASESQNAYDLLGRKINPDTYKGIYIQSGKKYIAE